MGIPLSYNGYNTTVCFSNGDQMYYGYFGKNNEAFFKSKEFKYIEYEFHKAVINYERWLLLEAKEELKSKPKKNIFKKFLHL